MVVDPFTGSGTTAAVCKEWGRNFAGCDLRQSQVDLARRRVELVTPDMFAAVEGQS
jgi:DNA modification methylase